MVIFKATFKSPTLKVTRAYYWYNGVAVVVNAKMVNVRNENQTIADCSFINAYVGIACGRVPQVFQRVCIHCPAPTRLLPVRNGKEFKRIDEDHFSLTPQVIRPENLLGL